MTLALRIHPIRGPIQRWTWTHPQWWSLVLAAGAWAAMAPHWLAAGHHHGTFPTLEARSWVLMVGAMMLPLLGEPIRALAFCNFASRRHAAIALFLLGYVTPWTALAPSVAWVRGQSWGQHWLAPVAAFLFGALWFLTPAWERAHRLCHSRRAFAVSGWRWARDTLRLGARQGLACIGTCLPVMIGCVLTGHALVVMLAGLALGQFERRAFWPPRLRLAAACVSLAAGAMLLG